MTRFDTLSFDQKQQIIALLLYGKLNSSLRNKDDAEAMVEFIWELLRKLGVDVPKPYVEVHGATKDKHRRLTPDQRNQVQQLLSAGYNYSEIARTLNIDRRTVSKIDNN